MPLLKHHFALFKMPLLCMLWVPNLISNENKMKRTKIDEVNVTLINFRQQKNTYFSLHFFAFSHLYVYASVENVRNISHPSPSCFPFRSIFSNSISLKFLNSQNMKGVVLVSRRLNKSFWESGNAKNYTLFDGDDTHSIYWANEYRQICTILLHGVELLLKWNALRVRPRWHPTVYRLQYECIRWRQRVQ